MGISYGICGNLMCVYTVCYVYGFDKLTIFLLKKRTWRVAKYGDPYSEFVLCIYPIQVHTHSSE